MRWRNSREQWGAVAKTLHWAIAGAILVNIPLGLWADDLALSPTKVEAFYWHKNVGLTVLWLAVLRLLWRFTNPTPRLPEGMPGWERALAHGSHVLLYAALLAIPISGWVIHSASNFPLDLYGLVPVPDIVPAGIDEKAAEDAAAAVHYWIFITICVLLSLHVAGAAKHHFINSDDVLRRMMPFARPAALPRTGDAQSPARGDPSS